MVDGNIIRHFQVISEEIAHFSCVGVPTNLSTAIHTYCMYNLNPFTFSSVTLYLLSECSLTVTEVRQRQS